MIRAAFVAFLVAVGLAVGAAPAAPHAATPAGARAAAPTATPLPPRPTIPHVPPARFTVLPMGDSITLGVNGSNSGYRGPLLQALPTLTYVGSQGTAPLLHEGHSGWRTDQLLAIAPATLAQYRPSFVLLHAGTNDAVQNIPPPTMAANMGALLDAIVTASPNTRILVALIPLSPWATPTQQSAEAALNAALPGLAAARAPWVTIVDMRLQPEDLSDGVHPNDGGYAKMAARWAAALPEVMAT